MKFAAFILLASLSCLAATAIAIDDQNIDPKITIREDEKCAANLITDAVKVAERVIDDIKDCQGILNEREEKIMNATQSIIEAAPEVTQAYELDCSRGRHTGCRKIMSEPFGDLVGKVARAGSIMLNIGKAFPGAVRACVVNAIHGTRVGRQFVKFPHNARRCMRWSI